MIRDVAQVVIRKEILLKYPVDACKSVKSEKTMCLGYCVRARETTANWTTYTLDKRTLESARMDIEDMDRMWVELIINHMHIGRFPEAPIGSFPRRWSTLCGARARWTGVRHPMRNEKDHPARLICVIHESKLLGGQKLSPRQFNRPFRNIQTRNFN